MNCWELCENLAQKESELIKNNRQFIINMNQS